MEGRSQALRWCGVLQGTWDAPRTSSARACTSLDAASSFEFPLRHNEGTNASGWSFALIQIDWTYLQWARKPPI